MALSWLLGSRPSQPPARRAADDEGHRRRPALTMAQQRAILTMHAEGQPAERIASVVKCSRSSIYRTLQRGHVETRLQRRRKAVAEAARRTPSQVPLAANRPLTAAERLLIREYRAAGLTTLQIAAQLRVHQVFVADAIGRQEARQQSPLYFLRPSEVARIRRHIDAGESDAEIVRLFRLVKQGANTLGGQAEDAGGPPAAVAVAP
ncbi:MAG: helix-turn-helix domain-containing protein [Chloroflexota bacterium]